MAPAERTGAHILIGLLLLATPIEAFASNTYTLENKVIRAQFTEKGLAALDVLDSRNHFGFKSDGLSLTLNGKVLSLPETAPDVRRGAEQVEYRYVAGPYKISVVYELKSGWRFLSKQIILTLPSGGATRIDNIEVIRTILAQVPRDVYVHKSPFRNLQTKDYGAFIRFGDGAGLLATVQNPFVSVATDGALLGLGYAPEMDWRAEYGAFASDRAILAPYRLQNDPVNLSMIPEWKINSVEGSWSIDRAEVETFTDVVRAFMTYRPQKPLNIFVGWCANDYQIDIARPEGRDEYKRMIDRAAELGAEYVLFAPTNSDLSRRQDSTDDWKWENLLWLGLGQKIRRNEWNVLRDSIPGSVQEMLDYARGKNVKLVAYVYPVLPFSQNPEWLVRGSKYHQKKLNASLGVRNFQDWLLQELVAFQKRTEIGGYGFDYTFLWYDGTSRYAQWYGWRRVMEGLRANLPDTVIDGRQLYMQYGPWIWLAGSYPHPTSTDEQPESFVPFPDLHFDRVSAARQRYTAYRFKNMEFCPTELMPGFIGHQTPRNDDSGEMPSKRVARPAGDDTELLPFRARDWDYLGWRYSLLSSVATAGWNNVLNMIPARDKEEFEHFSRGDKEFFREWLDWTEKHKEILRHTRTIGLEPAIGRVDGTAAVDRDHGFVFLFNPNAREMRAEFALSPTIGLSVPGQYMLRELYPVRNRLVGNGQAGFWSFGQQVFLEMDGTSVVVLEVVPAPTRVEQPILFNVPGTARIESGVLQLSDVLGEVGVPTDALVLLPSSTAIAKTQVNSENLPFIQNGNTVAVKIRFDGPAFPRSRQVISYDPRFAGGVAKGSFKIPGRVFDQLRNRRQQWPIRWTQDDLRTPWLAPERLLLFVQLAEPDDRIPAELKLNGKSVQVERAYSSIRKHAPSFVGFYADVSGLLPEVEYTVELKLGTLRPGQFQGLFFDNVETEYTKNVAKAESR